MIGMTSRCIETKEKVAGLLKRSNIKLQSKKSDEALALLHESMRIASEFACEDKNKNIPDSYFGNLINQIQRGYENYWEAQK